MAVVSYYGRCMAEVSLFLALSFPGEIAQTHVFFVHVKYVMYHVILYYNIIVRLYGGGIILWPLYGGGITISGHGITFPGEIAQTHVFFSC